MPSQRLMFVAPALALLSACWALACWPSHALAQNEELLVRGVPFDQLVLKGTEEQSETTLQLVPLELRPRRPLQRPEAAAETSLKVRLLSRPGTTYQVLWSDIGRLTLFEQLVLQQGAQLVQAKRFGDAYECYDWIGRRDPEFPGYQEAFVSCLLAEAEWWKAEGNIAQALALCYRAYELNSQAAGLGSLMGSVVDVMLEKVFQEKKYRAGRRLLAELQRRFPNHRVVRRWQDQFSRLAAGWRQRARQAQQAGRWGDAYEAIFQAVSIWPQDPNTTQLYREIAQRYPVVAVAVWDEGHPPTAAEAGAEVLSQWTVRRQAALTTPLIAEPQVTSFGDFKYDSRLIRWMEKDDEYTLSLPGPRSWLSSGGRPGLPVTAYDLARTLLDRARGEGEALGRSSFDPTWAQMAATLQVVDPQTLKVRFASKVLSPQAFWQVPLVPWSYASQPTNLSEFGEIEAWQEGSTDAFKPSLGDYRPLAHAEGGWRFVRSDAFAAGSSQALADGGPHEIVERRFSDIRQAVAGLRAGRFVAVDRVPPWQLDEVLRHPDVVLKPYPVPTIHLLVPNLHSPRLQEPTSRRGVLLGINRTRILRQLILGSDQDLGRVLSGPFAGGSVNDRSLPPEPYDPQLMIALAAAPSVATPSSASRRNSGSSQHLRLAYPPTALARRVCTEIVRQLQLRGQGLAVEGVELTPVQALNPRACRQHWDLLYVERVLADPRVDAGALLQLAGVELSDHPLLAQALSALAAAEDKQQLTSALQRLDQEFHRECWVLPLWELTEHYAQRKSLKGVGHQPLTLYQNIKSWRHPPPVPEQ